MVYKIKCANCRKEGYVSKINRKTCSYDCAKEYHKRMAKERARLKVSKGFYKEKRKCKFCNKEFIWSSSRHQQVYCSKVCQKKFHKKRWGDLSKGIITRGNGKSFNFYRLRFEIFKRDNFTCQYCGRNVKEDKIKLHCDHINPKKKGGLFIPNNLITSCEECNVGKRDVLLEKKNLIETHQ